MNISFVCIYDYRLFVCQCIWMDASSYHPILTCFFPRFAAYQSLKITVKVASCIGQTFQLSMLHTVMTNNNNNASNDSRSNSHSNGSETSTAAVDIVQLLKDIKIIENMGLIALDQQSDPDDPSYSFSNR